MVNLKLPKQRGFGIIVDKNGARVLGAAELKDVHEVALVAEAAIEANDVMGVYENLEQALRAVMDLPDFSVIDLTAEMRFAIQEIPNLEIVLPG